jgi:hypothetical protein
MLMRFLLIVALAVLGYLVWRRVQAFLNGTPAKGQVRKRADGQVLSDMEKCRVCGIYVAAGMGRCNRVDCPRR